MRLAARLGGQQQGGAAAAIHGSPGGAAGTGVRECVFHMDFEVSGSGYGCCS